MQGSLQSLVGAPQTQRTQDPIIDASGLLLICELGSSLSTKPDDAFGAIDLNAETAIRCCSISEICKISPKVWS